MKEIKVSVIVPIYNTDKFLRKCIESIVNQTLEEIEIILINDGSTDNSHNICLEYVNRYSKKIRYINNKNIGCSATRNLGIDLARGEYIAFVDSDDYIEKEMYEKMYEKAHSNNYDILICGITSILLNNNNLNISLPSKNNNKYECFSYRKKISNPVNKLFKRIIIKDLKFIKNTHSFEDFNFCFKAFTKSKKIGYIYKSFYNYIFHGENSVYNLEKRIGIFISFKDLYEYLLENNFSKDKMLMKKYYECFNYYAIRGVFFMILNPKRVSNEEYKKYNKIFSTELNKIEFLTLKSEILIFYYKNLVFLIRKFKLYFILKKINDIIKNRKEK